MIKNILATVAIAATALATIGTSAQAGDWNGRSYGYGYGPRHGYAAPAPRHYPAYGYHQPRRDRTGEKIATGVAIGVGALILGSVLANEARRNREQGY